MKIVTLIVMMSLAHLSYAEIGADKFAHAGVSAGLNLTFYTLFSNALGREVGIRPGALVMSSMLTLGIGLMKEVDDSVVTHSPYLDGGDLAADLVGIGVSALGIYLVDIHGQKDMTIGYKDNRLVVGWRF